MRIIEPDWDYVGGTPDGLAMLKKIEAAGRVCYKSESKITDESAKRFVAGIIKSGHHSVIEHCSVSVVIVCDRGVTHELVRHRLASYSQESTRYCNYGKEKFGAEITFVQPSFELNDVDKAILAVIESHYLLRLETGLTPQEARYFLPNGLKTEIIVTANIREWRHIFALRTSPKAHPDIRRITTDILDTFLEDMPVLFEDI
jgi:thymidylate synthase (FAD)